MRAFRLLAAFALAVGCTGPADRAAPGAAADPNPGRVHRFEGTAGSYGSVTHRIAPDGWQTLTGDTVRGGGPADRRSVREAATLDARGTLVHAELTVERASDDGPEHVVLDQPTGTVEVRTRRGTRRSHVPNDVPWVYAPTDDGPLVATPLGAWIAFRATRAGEIVRIVRPDAPDALVTYLAPIDQVALDTERGTTVVLNHDGIDVGREFVDELRWTDAGLGLGCRSDGPAGAGS